MRIIAVVLLLGSLSFAQIHRVSPEESVQHLTKTCPPQYPPLAQLARITGNVIIEIDVDESGLPTVNRLISGHPMLRPAAMDAVKACQYRPFQIKGQAVPVRTLIIIRFGNYWLPEDENEIRFQQDFWAALDAARYALENGGTAEDAGTLLAKAWTMFPASDRPLMHITERSEWNFTMGELRISQKKYEEAEQQYNAVLARYKEYDVNSVGSAIALAKLAQLYLLEKKYELAQDYSSRSVRIYRKKFKETSSRIPKARQKYGNEIAMQSWMLSTLAIERKDTADATKQCRTVLEFQAFLESANRDAYVPACQEVLGKPGAAK